MAVIALPSTPLYNAGTPFLVSQAQDLTSPVGGQAQRITRVGSRYGIDVTYPSMKYADGANFIATMMLSEVNPVSIVLPQRGFTVGAPGTCLVNGAGQSGATLAIRGATVGYTFAKGQLLDFIFSTTGRRFVHMITAATVVPGGGHATLPIWPMLRVSPVDGDALELTSPTLEGFIQLNARKIPWTIDLVRRIGVKFTVLEDR